MEDKTNSSNLGESSQLSNSVQHSKTKKLTQDELYLQASADSSNVRAIIQSQRKQQAEQQPPPSRVGTRAAHQAQQRKFQALKASQIQAKSPYAQHIQTLGQRPNGSSSGLQVPSQQPKNRASQISNSSQKSRHMEDEGSNFKKSVEISRSESAQSHLKQNRSGTQMDAQRSSKTANKSYSINQNSNNIEMQFQNSHMEKPGTSNSNQQQQNKRIAQIYGKSNKFVGSYTSGAINNSNQQQQNVGAAQGLMALQQLANAGTEKKSKFNQFKNMIQQKTKQTKFVNMPKKNLNTSAIVQNAPKNDMKGIRRIKVDQQRLKSVQRDNVEDAKSRSMQQSRLINPSERTHGSVILPDKQDQRLLESQSALNEQNDITEQDKELDQLSNVISPAQRGQKKNIKNMEVQKNLNQDSRQDLKKLVDKQKGIGRVNSQTERDEVQFQRPNFFNNDDFKQGSDQLLIGDGGSFSIVNESQLENADIRKHGFTLTEENLQPNAMANSQVSQNNLIIQHEQIYNNFGDQIIKSHEDSDQYILFDAQNNVKFSNSQMEEKTDQKTTQPAHAPAGEADLEALNKFFKQSEEQQNQEEIHQQINLQDKRLQTSQGPRVQKYHQAQKRQENTVQIDENSDEDLKSEYQNEADVESQFSESGSSEDLSPKQKGQQAYNQFAQGEYDRPVQTAPSSQMKNIQAKDKLLKIKDKLRVQNMMNEEKSRDNQSSSLEMKKQFMASAGLDDENVMNLNDENVKKAQFSKTIDPASQNMQFDDCGKKNELDQNKTQQHGEDSKKIIKPNLGIDQLNKSGSMNTKFFNKIQHQRQAHTNEHSQIELRDSEKMDNSRPLSLNGQQKESKAQGQRDLNQLITFKNPEAQIPVAQNPLGYQFENLKRPPSRQKQPNQALGLDDDTRPKTRGNNKSGSLNGTTIAHHNQLFVGGGQDRGLSKREKRMDRKRNIKQFIQNDSGSGSNLMYHLNEQAQGDRKDVRQYQGRNNMNNAPQQTQGNRVRMIDFFHQRNNNGTNGFNSTDEYQQNAMQAFQSQYQKRYEDRNQAGFSSLHKQNSLSGGGNNPRRGQKATTENTTNSELQRPPSRHKDPPQNLGLDIFPPGMGMAEPDEFDPPPGMISQDFFDGNQRSTGGVFSGFDIDHDPSMEGIPIKASNGVTSGSEFGDDMQIENAKSYRGKKIKAKQFKEDEDDFIESTYLTQNQEPQSKQKQKIKFHRQQSGEQSQLVANSGTSLDRKQIQNHQRRSTSKYGYPRANQSSNSFRPSNQAMNQTMPSNYHLSQQFAQTYGQHLMNQMQGNANVGFQYHPALQQTQNFYIGMNQLNQILPNQQDQNSSNFVNDLFNMSADVQNMIKTNANKQASTQQYRQEEVKTPHQSKRLMSTSHGPGVFPNQGNSNNQTMSAFQPTGVRLDMRQNDSSRKTSNMNYRQINANQVDLLQRGFINQRSPVNDRSGSIHHLLMQNPQLKQATKPKSATGHRINGGKQSKCENDQFILDRLKNLNNSGRFFQQNSTIIHSAYQNPKNQPVKMYQQPINGGWVDGINNQSSTGPEAPSSMAHTQNTEGKNLKINKHQVQNVFSSKTGASVNSNGVSSTNARAKLGGHFFLKAGESNSEVPAVQSNQFSETDHNMQDRIKLVQDQARPKESKGHRSTEKRATNNSLGTTQIITTDPVIKESEFMTSPASNEKKQQIQSKGVDSKQRKFLSVYSMQMSTNAGGGQQTGSRKGGSMQSTKEGQIIPTDKLEAKELEIPNMGENTKNSILSGQLMLSNNQTSFKSQTLQLPNNFNSQLSEDFQKLFAK